VRNVRLRVPRPLMGRIWRWAVPIGVVCFLVPYSCSSPKYTRVDYAGGWSVDCPAEFQHSFNNLSQGPYGELDMTSPSGSIQISVHGLNLPYASVVDYANNEGSAYMKGSLVARGESLSVFEFKAPDAQTGTLRQHVYVVRDLGSMRTGIVEGKTESTGQSATVDLTRYSNNVANSMTALPAWTSDGKGGPGP